MKYQAWSVATSDPAGRAALEQAGVEAKSALASCGEGIVTHGSSEQLKKKLGLDGDSLFHRAMEVLGRG